MNDFDELETIADSTRLGNVPILEHQKNGLEAARNSSNQTRDADLQPGNRLRMSAHTPSLQKLKFMQGDGA